MYNPTDVGYGSHMTQTTNDSPPAHSAVQVLDEALRILEADGWCGSPAMTQFNGMGPDGSTCLGFAISEAGSKLVLAARLPEPTAADVARYPDGLYNGCKYGPSFWVRVASNAVTRVIEDDLGERSSISAWNDNHARDFSDVLTVVKRARDSLLEDPQ